MNCNIKQIECPACKSLTNIKIVKSDNETEEYYCEKCNVKISSAKITISIVREHEVPKPKNKKFITGGNPVHLGVGEYNPVGRTMFPCPKK